MKTVVVAGQARKVGKTAVLAALIRALRPLTWTAVKISQHRGYVPHSKSVSKRRVGQRPGFLLTEETTASNTCDTGRFLTAGAKRALWLRVRSENFADGFRALWRAVKNDRWIMIESNGILDNLAPTLCVLVLDSSQRAFKATARRLLPRADAVIQIKRPIAPRYDSNSIPPRIPVFSVCCGSSLNSCLRNFVRRKLQIPADSSSRESSRERNPHVGIEQE